MNTGKRIHDEAVRTYRLATVVTVRCCHCRRFRITGPLGDVRDAYLEHRRDRHPDLPAPRARAKLKAGAWQTGSKHLDDNIRAARLVGAGRNAR